MSKWIIIFCCLCCACRLHLLAQLQESNKEEQIQQLFDTNHDGKLDDAERTAMNECIKARKEEAKQKEPDSYQWATGPLPVTSVPLHTLPNPDDEKRPLPLRLTFPILPGQYPVIIFSHGMYGSKDTYRPLIQFWASHGYVCIQTSHADSLVYGKKTPQEAIRAGGESRPKDIVTILDALSLLDKDVPGLQGKMIQNKIGIGGHSFGAHTAQLLAGTTVYVGLLRQKKFYDARINCALIISPQGKSLLLREKSFTQIAMPAMFITGTNDASPIQPKSAEWRLDAYKLSPPGDKYLLWIEGAYHGFGGITGNAPFPSSGPAIPEQVTWVQEASLKFFDTYLQQNPESKKLLQQDWLNTQAPGKLKLEHK